MRLPPDGGARQCAPHQHDNVPASVPASATRWSPWEIPPDQPLDRLTVRAQRELTGLTPDTLYGQGLHLIRMLGAGTAEAADQAYATVFLGLAWGRMCATAGTAVPW